MIAEISDEERKILLKILKWGRARETAAPQWPELEAEGISELKQWLQKLEPARHPSFAALQRVYLQLERRVTPRLIQDLLVPVERLLNQSAKDHDFLIFSEDKLTTNSNLRPLVGVFDHIRSAFNVGGIFRTANAFGLSSIHLIGYTPSPEESSAAKSSLGSHQSVRWKKYQRLEESLESLRRDNYQLIAFETTSHAQSLYDFKFPDRSAIIFGNERFGLSPSDIEGVDSVVTIPMLGSKVSMNIVSCFSIACFEYARQHGLEK